MLYFSLGGNSFYMLVHIRHKTIYKSLKTYKKINAEMIIGCKVLQRLYYHAVTLSTSMHILTVTHTHVSPTHTAVERLALLISPAHTYSCATDTKTY